MRFWEWLQKFLFATPTNEELEELERRGFFGVLRQDKVPENEIRRLWEESKKKP